MKTSIQALGRGLLSCLIVTLMVFDGAEANSSRRSKVNSTKPNPGKTHALPEYILDKDELLRLPPEQQVAYAYFLLTLVYLGEQLELRAGTTSFAGSASLPENIIHQTPRLCTLDEGCTEWPSSMVGSEAPFGWQGFNQNLVHHLETWLVPRAEAIVPALVAVGGALVRAGGSASGRQLVTAAASKGKSLWTTVESFWTSSAAPRMGQTITQGAAKAPKYYSQKVLAATGAAVAIDETARRALGGSAEASQAPAKLPPTAPGDEDPPPPPLPAPVAGPAYARAEGAFCIFGGYVSEYKRFGDDVKCTRPTDLAMPQCPNPKTQFRCNDFGMSRGAPPQAVCVDLNGGGGLRDLTARCTNAVFASWGPEGPDGLDTARYEQAQQAVQAVKEQIKRDFNLSKYCQDVNKANEKKQSVECASLRALLEFASTKLSGVPAVIASRSAEGAAAASPSAPGAESTSTGATSPASSTGGGAAR